MLHNVSCIIVLAVLITFAVAQREDDNNDKKIVCYYTNWSVNRPGNAKFPPTIVNAKLCTHLIYAFATFMDYGLAPGDLRQDIENNGFREFNDLKEENDQLRTLLSIGGWAEGSSRFSTIAESHDRRAHFIQSSIELLRKYHFDGINIDWQYPAFRDGSKPEDRENYVQLMKELRETFEDEAQNSNRARLLITMSIPAEIEYNEKGHDLLNLQKYADFMNILAYDYHLSYEANVGHHAPLYPLLQEIETNTNTQLNADATVRYLLEKGMMKEKLNLGIPTFGRTYKLENKDNHNLGAPSKGIGIRGETSKEEGYRTYYEICQSIKKDNWTVVHINKTALGPYAYKGEDWVGYDDPAIVYEKGRYAREKGLGGIMFWTIDDDDFRHECGDRKFPLISAGRRGVLGLRNRETRTGGIEPKLRNITPEEATTAKMMSSTNGMKVRPTSTTDMNDIIHFPTKSNNIKQNPSDSVKPNEMLMFPPDPVKPDNNVPSSIEPIKITGKKSEGGDNYFQTITIWIINNIVNLGDKV